MTAPASSGELFPGLFKANASKVGGVVLHAQSPQVILKSSFQTVSP